MTVVRERKSYRLYHLTDTIHDEYAYHEGNRKKKQEVQRRIQKFFEVHGWPNNNNVIPYLSKMDTDSTGKCSHLGQVEISAKEVKINAIEKGSDNNEVEDLSRQNTGNRR